MQNRVSWSGGKRTSAEVPAITSSSSGHSGFNMVSVWLPGPSSPVPAGRGGIVGLVRGPDTWVIKQKMLTWMVVIV